MTAFYPEGVSGMTVALTNGATELTFSGTALLANVKVGDELIAAGGSGHITEVIDDETATIFPPWDGTNGPAVAFRIVRGPEWAPTSVLNQQANLIIQLLRAGLLMAPNAYSTVAGDRDQYDGQRKGFLFALVPAEGSGDPAQMCVKDSDANGDWSDYWENIGPAGADGATVGDVLAALGVNHMTISTADPSGGVDNDLWFKVPA